MSARPDESAVSDPKPISFPLMVIVVMTMACVAYSVGGHLRYVSRSARPTWPQTTAELDGIVASASGEKTSDFQVTKSQSGSFSAEVGFRRPQGPIVMADMNRAMAQHGWSPAGATYGGGRLYCKGDLVARVEGSAKDSRVYVASVTWGTADSVCGRR